jgi:hypothetical protein
MALPIHARIAIKLINVSAADYGQQDLGKSKLYVGRKIFFS